MSGFKFNLSDRVQLVTSGESGIIKGRAEYTDATNSYQVLYKAADGRQSRCWWQEDEIEPAP